MLPPKENCTAASPSAQPPVACGFVYAVVMDFCAVAPAANSNAGKNDRRAVTIVASGEGGGGVAGKRARAGKRQRLRLLQLARPQQQASSDSEE